jgi:hypothetical protein
MNITRDVRNKRFWRGFLTHSLSALGVIAALLGVYDIFVPRTLEKVDFPQVLIVPALALLYAGWRSWPYPIEQHYSTPDMQIRLITGDLFAQPCNLVIGMCDTFDVETPHIIATTSVQGQFLERIYQRDVSGLRGDVRLALARVSPIAHIEKEGNTDKYAIGTVATIKHQRKQYYCVAYTEMDHDNNVASSIGMLWESLTKLWDEVRKESNGDPVAIPVIGLGQSGMSAVLPIQDSIRFIILSFMFASRQRRVCNGLDIVLRAQDEKRVDMLEIQAFLKSLRNS